MAESSGQSEDENVINILVIKEPPDWQQCVTADPCMERPSVLENVIESIGGEMGKGGSGNTHCISRGNRFYKSQSFVIEGQQYPKIDVIPQDGSGNKPTVTVKNDVESFLSGPYQINSNSTDPRFFFTHVGETASLGSQTATQKYCVNIDTSNKVGPAAQTVELNGHKNIIFPKEVQNQSSSVETTIPLISAPDVSPQIFTSSVYYSPGLLSQNGIGKDSETPKASTIITTTPDSGFCTPSQFESASTNAFFTSTPRSSKSFGPKTSTPSFSETPRGSMDNLHQRFSEMYNAVDWDSFDDSCDLSEDLREEDSVEVSPNSSLRSVQWLKGFSIADSVKPLLSSPPTPNEGKCQTQNIETQGQNNPSSSESSNSSSFNYTCGDSAISTTSARSIFSSAALTPLPVIMAPTVPTYLQNQTSLSPQVAAKSAKAQDGGNKRGQRKALEELKMNKAEKNIIGRTKYTGRIFSRPGYSYMDLIKMAMQSSKEGEMTLKEIVTWIEDHFPFFKHEAKDSWKSSIRHNLSLHGDFMKADDKKHGCKWKLCKDAKVQHNLHVPAPQEITSQQSAYLKKVKRNAPQPILPKMNAYALVPIHNLNSPIVESQQPPAVPRKPVHILPKQIEEQQAVALPQSQEDCYYYYQNHQQWEMVNPPSQEHQVIQHLLQNGPQGNCEDSVMKEDLFDSCSVDDKVHVVHPSSSDNLSQLMSIVTSSNTTNQSACHSLNSVIGNEGEKQAHRIVKKKSMTKLSSSDAAQNFPLDSVVEIRQEEGAKPGEKKIIFVLQDAENVKQKKQNKNELISARSSSQDLSVNLCDKQPSNSKLSFPGKKKSKEGSKSRQPRGPVLNLQSVLQNSSEDKRASDALGMMLQEEDNERFRYEDGEEFDEFTRVKMCSRQQEMHLNSHMQRAFQEQGLSNHLNIIDKQAVGLDNLQENSLTEKFDNKGNSNNSSGKTSMSLNVKRAGRRDRMTIIKNRNPSCDSFDSLTSKSNTCSQDSFSSISCNTPSASQLVFRRLSSSDHSSLLSSISSHSPASSATPISDVSERDESTSRRVGNSSRSKSRRKQVHVPLNIEVSPVRSSSFLTNESLRLSSVVEESSGFIDISPEKQIQMKNFSIRTEQPVSLLTDIQQPSLEILQHKPLEHRFQSPLKQPPIEHKSTGNLEFFSCVDDNNRDIESIFCLGSPVKDKTERNVFQDNMTDSLFLSEFEAPPTLHFLSTFARETDSNNRVSVDEDKLYNSPRGKMSVVSSDNNIKYMRHHQFPVNFLEDDIQSYSTIDGSMTSVSQKRVCRDDNRGYGILNDTCHFSMPVGKEETKSSTFSSSSQNTFNSSPSMDTPPCGTSLRAPPVSLSTSAGMKTVRNINNHHSITSGGSTSSLSPSIRQVPPTSSSASSQHQSMFVSFSPSIYPAGSTADITAPFTPPCGTAPLFMSTPSRHHSWSVSGQTAQTQQQQQEVFPFYSENLSGILDSSFSENFDSFVNSLPGNLDVIGLGSISPSIHHSPDS